MFCTNCGKEIKEGNNFCTNCGTKINNLEKEIETNKIIENQEIKQEKITTTNNISEDYNISKKEKIYIIVGIIFIIFVAIKLLKQQGVLP